MSDDYQRIEIITGMACRVGAATEGAAGCIGLGTSMLVDMGGGPVTLAAATTVFTVLMPGPASNREN